MIPRLYISDPLLNQQQTVLLSQTASHYLKNVLKRQTGATVLLFNQNSGEWSGRLQLSKKQISVTLLAQTRQPIVLKPVTLLFAPIKKTPIDYLAAKATELGVTTLQPVLTERTIVKRLNLERLESNCIEAAEQSGRICIPTIRDTQKLLPYLQTLSDDQQILFCDEGKIELGKPTAPPILKILEAQKHHQNWSILIGPEGGFSPAELNAIRALSNSHSVSLGPRLLRADTAALAALTCWQSVIGNS